MRPTIRIAILVLLTPLLGLAQGPGVQSTVHNLSVSGPGDFRSLSETEVCKFCHVPHAAVVNEPLWGHALSTVARYKTPKRRQSGLVVESPQPEGASRLCLSCHDGTVALGDMGPDRSTISVAGGGQMGPGRRGFIGVDLSGSHLISIEIPAGPEESTSDIGIRPRSIIESDPDVRLDARGRMQCTSCHDPHSDRHYREGEVPHFYVKPTVSEACLVCHELR